MCRKSFTNKRKTVSFIYLIENIMKPIDRLRQQYKQLKEKQSIDSLNFHKIRYDAMRLFCLDCELLTFNDIELMEFEVDESFSF